MDATATLDVRQDLSSENRWELWDRASATDGAWIGLIHELSPGAFYASVYLSAERHGPFPSLEAATQAAAAIAFERGLLGFGMRPRRRFSRLRHHVQASNGP
jgi:hypothetical protein